MRCNSKLIICVTGFRHVLSDVDASEVHGRQRVGRRRGAKSDNDTWLAVHAKKEDDDYFANLATPSHLATDIGGHDITSPLA